MQQLSEGFIPSRHRRSSQVESMLGRLNRLMPGLRPPDEATWQAMGLALMRGDAAMDRLVTAMRRAGMRKARLQFEQALSHGIESVDRPLPALRRFMKEVSYTPDWFDAARAERGAALYRRCGVDALHIGRDVALMGGYQASAFNRTLILTGALQKGPTRRLAETLQWQLDCTARGGMRPHGPGWRSTLTVRFVHALVRQSVAARPDWQLADWGLPVNQADMAATLYATMTVPILGTRMLGMPQRRADRDDAAHLTRYMGWLIGVEDRWLADTEADAAGQLLQLLVSLTNPDETSPMMAQPLAAEPLGRRYRRFEWLQRRIDYAKHLSISRAFLGREAMQRLGLPSGMPPWYPLLNFPRSLGWHAASRIVPGGAWVSDVVGRRAQEAELRKLTDEQPAVVGGAALSGR